METRVHPARIACWASLVTLIAGLNYYARFTSSSSAGSSRDDVYSWSGFASGMIVYAIWLGFVLAIALDRTELLALRRPRSWRRVAAYCAGAIIAIYVV